MWYTQTKKSVWASKRILTTLCITISLTNHSSVKNNDKPMRLGLLRLTDYLVELKRCNPLTALDPLCIDVKEQRDHQGAGRSGSQTISPGEPSSLQVSPRQGN